MGQTIKRPKSSYKIVDHTGVTVDSRLIVKTRRLKY